MLGIPKIEEEAPPSPPPPPPAPQHPVSPLAEACSRMDLTAIQQILLTTHYRDDEGSNEVSIRAFWFQTYSFCRVLSEELITLSVSCYSFHSRNGHSR
jgi:hypothetical protein